MSIIKWKGSYLPAAILIGGLGLFLPVYLASNRNAALEATLKTGERLAHQGRAEVPACTGCHGAAGAGNRETGYPRLAGLHPDYLRKQLRDFARDPLDIGVKVEAIARDYTKTPRVYKDLTVYSPGIRSDAMMNPIAGALTPEDVAALSEYYARLPFKARPVAADFQTLENGRELAVRGKPEYRMPSCNSCHGPDGRGFGAVSPPLGGQPPAYIIAQIDKWQRGDRDNDNLSIMKNVANLLTDGDKATTAAYFDNLSYEVNR